jgi:hypothetical protein
MYLWHVAYSMQNSGLHNFLGIRLPLSHTLHADQSAGMLRSIKYASGDQCYKTFYGRKLRIFVIS